MTTTTIKQDTIQEQQFAAKFLMGVVSKMPFTKDAIVAGGAARDWFRGEPATDIDIFLIGTTVNNHQVIEHMAAHGFPLKMVSKFEPGAPDPRSGEEDYVINPYLKAVFDGHVESLLRGPCAFPEKIKFQIVVTTYKDLNGMMSSFPVEISKFTWDHLTGRIIGHGGAESDILNKTVTQTSVSYNGDKYIQKIRAKFPDHMFIPLAAPPVKIPVKRTNTPNRFSPVQFIFWLKGFFEMSKPRTIDAHQTQMIKENLDRAFDQATSEHSAGEEETQQEGRKIFRPKPVNYAQYITNNNDSAE